MVYLILALIWVKEKWNIEDNYWHSVDKSRFIKLDIELV